MDFIVKNSIYFGAIYLLIVLFYLIFMKKNYINKKYGKLSMEVAFITKKFDLDYRKTSYKTVWWTVTLVNAFIISFTSVVCMNIEKFVLSIVVGFILLMALIYSLYEIIGSILKKKEDKKNV